MQVIYEFLLIKLKEVTLDSNEKQSVKSKFYLSEDKRHISPFGYQDETSLLLENFEKSNMSANSKKEPGDQQKGDVNEIIVKIEMKKFQNLIENRIKHKNNLLQADIKRVYPMSLQKNRRDSIEFDTSVSKFDASHMTTSLQLSDEARIANTTWNILKQYAMRKDCRQ